MRTRLSLLLLAALPASALANPLTGQVTWQVSGDGGATWTSSLSLAPGDPYRIRAVASWTDDAFTSIGFAGATFEQIDLFGADSTDVFGGASGPGGIPTYLKRVQGLPESWSLQAGDPSVGGLKIDNVNPTARTNFGQLPKSLPGGFNPGFSSDNPIVIFLMDAIIGTGPKVLTISSTWARLGTPPVNQFSVYTTETGTSRKPVQEATLTPASITVIPAPSAPAILGLAVAGGRMRRRMS